MKEFKNVESMIEEVKPIEVNKTTTYVRTNIHKESRLMDEAKLDDDGNVLEEAIYMDVWVYDEIQYENKEYIELLANKGEAIQTEINIMKEIIDFFATVFPIK